MQKLARSILSANRKRRSIAVSFALWLLRIIHDIEEGEMNRFSDKLDELDPVATDASRRAYNAVEDEYLDCEYVIGFLLSAIEDLEFAYWEGF
jgi:hypothetical protein